MPAAPGGRFNVALERFSRALLQKPLGCPSGCDSAPWWTGWCCRRAQTPPVHGPLFGAPLSPPPLPAHLPTPPPCPSEGAAAPKPLSDGGTGGPGQLLLCIPSSRARASPSPPCWPKRCFGVKRGQLGWDPGGGHISGVTAQGTEQSGLQQLPLQQEEAPAEPTAAQTEQHPHGFSCLPAPLHQLAEPGIVPKHRGEQMVRADGRTRHSSPNYTNKYA